VNEKNTTSENTITTTTENTITTTTGTLHMHQVSDSTLSNADPPLVDIGTGFPPSTSTDQNRSVSPRVTITEAQKDIIPVKVKEKQFHKQIKKWLAIMKQNFSLRDQIYFVHTILTITSACFIIALSSIKIYSQTEYAIGHSMTASVLNMFTCVVFFFLCIQLYTVLPRSSKEIIHLLYSY